MDLRPMRIEFKYLVIFANRGVGRSFTLKRFCSSLVAPYRRGRHDFQLMEREKGVISIDTPSLVEDLSIVWIQLVQLQRHVHRILVTLETGIGSHQLQTAHTFGCRIRRGLETFFESRQGFLVLPLLR